jgi:hypothetical protein
MSTKFISDKNLTLRDKNGACHHVSKGMEFTVDGRKRGYVNVPSRTVSKDFYDRHFNKQPEAPVIESADSETKDED